MVKVIRYDKVMTVLSPDYQVGTLAVSRQKSLQMRGQKSLQTAWKKRRNFRAFLAWKITGISRWENRPKSCPDDRGHAVEGRP